MNSPFKRGFTLIELLIVITIITILATAVVLVLNPAELIKQSRDATRISDMATLNGAIALYLADVKDPGIGGPDNNSCSTATAWCTFAPTGSDPFNVASCSTNATTTVDGNGWVRVDFLNSSTTPLSRLPLDPVNNGTYFYGYACSGLKYELNANMESAKFAKDGSNDVESNTKDGGDNNDWYEIGNAPGLDI